MTDASAQRLISIDELAAYNGQPLFLFIGIQTTGSRVHDLFPRWASALGLEAVLRGVDLPEESPAEVFQQLVATMRDNPHVHGAVITSHKLRLYRAVSHLLTYAEPLVELTHEINSLDVRDGVKAFARDAQSLEVLFDTDATLLARRPQVVCLGSGGSAIALMLALGLDLAATVQRSAVTARPQPLTPVLIVGRRQAALDDVSQVASRAGLLSGALPTVLASSPAEWDWVVTESACRSLIINATGLGKLSEGSPISDAARFPKEALAWEFNYRGPLTFLAQARAAPVESVDGFEYFLAGWSCALAAILDRDPADVLRSVAAAS